MVLDMAERVLAPMKRISGASNETARALKAARDRLKELNDQQAAVGNVQKQAAELARLNNALKVKQALLDGMRASGTATAAQLKREDSGVRKLADALEVPDQPLPPAFLGTIAACHAATGDFAGALEHERRALDIAQQRQPPLAHFIAFSTARIADYSAGRAYVEPPGGEDD